MAHQFLRITCALWLVALTGCTSGMRPFQSATARDPFLDDSELVASTDEARGSDLGESASPLGEPSTTAGAGVPASGDGAAEDHEKIDAELFADFQTDADQPAGTVNQSGHEQIEPQTESGSRFDRGLGSVSPWGEDASESSAPPVALGFEPEGDSLPQRTGRMSAIDIEGTPDSFPTEGIEADGLTDVPQEPNESGAFEDEPTPETAEGRRWGFDRGFGLFGREERAAEETEKDTAESEFDPVDVIEERLKREGKSIRDRFSRLGARFGLGEEESGIPVATEPGTVEPTPECIDELITSTQSRLEGQNFNRLNADERESYIRDHVNLRLFYLVNDQHELALDAIPGIPPSEQEFWQQMFWSLSQYRNVDAIPDRTERITQTVSQLRTALQRLQEDARLQLSNVCFCNRIDGYGNYERFESEVFRPGQPVLVYSEVENFRTEPTSSGHYRTLLRSSLRIFPEDGSDKPVDSVTLRAVEDICRNPRRDYFNSYEFTIPNDIAPGPYVLELTIDDRLSGKSAKQSILFTVR